MITETSYDFMFHSTTLTGATAGQEDAGRKDRIAEIATAIWTFARNYTGDLGDRGVLLLWYEQPELTPEHPRRRPMGGSKRSGRIAYDLVDQEDDLERVVDDLGFDPRTTNWVVERSFLEAGKKMLKLVDQVTLNELERGAVTETRLGGIGHRVRDPFNRRRKSFDWS